MKRRLLIVLLALGGAAGLCAQQKDVFAAIALETPPPQRPHGAEKRPPVLPDVQVESSKSDASVVLPHRKTMRTREEFRAGIAELRKRYAPFLEDRTPAAPATRDRIELDTFQFRMEEAQDRQDFGRVWRGEGTWTTVRIPDYRGPVGWWAGYYRKALDIPAAVRRHQSIVLRFGAVDYKCQVYLNGRLLGTHEGYFAPFEFDATPYLRPDGENILVVRVENESIMMGLESWRGPDVDGDKIYAAVGPGWDEPIIGWHECPPGAGIWQKVYLEGRPKLSVGDIFVRPLPDEEAIEARIEVKYSETRNRPVELSVSVYPRNFPGRPYENIAIKTEPAGPGSTEYRARIRLGDFRKWEPESPFLYTLRASVRPKDGGPPDVRDAQFGMRTFTMDETSAVKGTLYLNGEPLILRGANTMGNFEVPVMRGNLDQVIEDVLIAKLANMNYFRLTQSPVQPEIYELCDRLGMMLQTDLPLFGYLRRPQLEEAVRQSGEMERLIRNHPSSIMISYINEPFAAERSSKAHRHLTRPELELFFRAASAVVRAHNPDRVIKPIDGDYDPPSPGFPDNHIYSTWYGSHAVPIGKFIRGYWVGNKDGWKHGSGEYGVEGLEDAETMWKYYPKDWLPASPDARWNPGKIPFAQTWTMHGPWFDEQETMRDWIAASQAHQAWGTREMTRAFRRQSDRIVSTAVHLLIDAWPSGWMKTLVDVDRRPKPAFFEFREALTPLMADMRTDRTRYYTGEKLALEFWIANDRRAVPDGEQLVWEVWRNGERVFANSAPARIPSFGAAFQGYFRYTAPEVSGRERLKVRLGIRSRTGGALHDSEIEIEVFPRIDTARNKGVVAGIVGRQGGRAWKLAGSLGLEPRIFTGSAAIVFVDSPDAFEIARGSVLSFARGGGRVVFLEQDPGTLWRIESAQVAVRGMRGREFVSRKTGHPLVAGFQPFDFFLWYDREKDFIEYVATSYLEGEGLKPILLTGDAARPGDPDPKRRTMPVAAELQIGKGSAIFTQLKATARVEYEPVAAAYYLSLISGARP